MSLKIPSAAELSVLLGRSTSIAIVGFSSRTHRPSYRVAAGLQRVGYRIIPVRPGIDEGLGQKAYAHLSDLSEIPDIVGVFRSAEHVPAIVDECLALGCKILWLQDGIVNVEAAERATAGGMTVVMDRCMLRDYLSFCA